MIRVVCLYSRSQYAVWRQILSFVRLQGFRKLFQVRRWNRFVCKKITLLKLLNICHMSADNHYPILLKVLFRRSLDSYHSLCFVLSGHWPGLLCLALLFAHPALVLLLLAFPCRALAWPAVSRYLLCLPSFGSAGSAMLRSVLALLCLGCACPALAPASLFSALSLLCFGLPESHSVLRLPSFGLFCLVLPCAWCNEIL